MRDEPNECLRRSRLGTIPFLFKNRKAGRHKICQLICREAKFGLVIVLLTMNLSRSGMLAVVLLSIVSLVQSYPTDGAPTRFVTDKLPRGYSRSSVTHSRNGNFMASVGNGYLGTVIYSDTVHISGVFNGPSYPKKQPIYPIYLYQHTHRARVPSTASVNFNVKGILGNSSYALDVSEGVFYKWFKATNLTVEQRVYAHRTRKNLLVVEITAKNKAGREFSMNIVPNLGYVTEDIRFFMTESFRGDALAATGLVSFMIA